MAKSVQKNILEDQQDHCLNCEHKFLDQKFVFCPNCGQHTQDRLTLGILFRNTIASYISLDSKFLTSLLPLLFLPGKVAREFVDGKRLKHLHPSQAYVMYSLVFFFIFSIYSSGWETPQLVRDGEDVSFSMVDRDDDMAKPDSLHQDVASLDSLKDEIKKINDLHRLDSLIALDRSNTEILDELDTPSSDIMRYIGSKAINIYRDKGSGLTGTALAQIPLSIFLLVPIYALFLWIINIRRKKTYAENLAHALYLFSFVFFTLTVILSLIWITEWTPWLILYLFVPPVYFLLSFMHFYQQGFFKSLVKLIIISALFSIIIFPMALGLTTLLSLVFY